MADINLAPTNYELEAIQKQRRMAELLGQQAIQPIEMPQVPGARISPIQGIAKLLQAYISNKNLKKADTEEKQYQSDYLSDLGFLMRNAGKTTPATAAIPEKIENITTPIDANRNLQEVALRQSLMRDPNAAINPFERQMGMDERAQVAKLPGQTVEERVTPAVPAMPSSPMLSADLLSGNNANGYIKTGAGKMALAQYLMQQQAQQQAAAQAELAASRQLHAFNPEQNVGTFSGGQFNTIIQGKPKEQNVIGIPSPADFTPESLATYAISKNYADLLRNPKEVNAPAAAQNYEYYVKQETDAGRKPLSFKDFELLKVREGRAQAPPRERMVFDANRGGTVNLDTGEFKPVQQGGVDIGVKPKDLKPVPPTINTAMTQNQVVLNKIARAEDLLTKTPEATGMFKGMMPDAILNRTDKEGTATRAALAELAATKVHDLSGAAVSVSEFGRLKPFLPQPTDNADTLRTKLAGMKTEVEDIVNATNQIYSEEQGYKPIPSLAPKLAASADAPPVTALKEGQTTTFANGQQWTLQKGKQVRVK